MLKLKKPSVRRSPSPPKTPELLEACVICEYAHRAATELLALFDESRSARRTSGGATTDAEQDLLRAMLVFASAGLDATLKRIVVATISSLVKKDPRVRAQLAKYCARKLRGRGDAFKTLDTDFLGIVLAGKSPRDVLIKSFAEDLTGNSLQSLKEVQRVAENLGIDRRTLGVSDDDLREAFDVRNRIVHEMDADPEGARRKRVTRKRDEMLQHINTLLALADTFLNAVDRKLSA